MSPVAEGLDLHISNGYIDFAMRFSVLVEMMNQLPFISLTPSSWLPALAICDGASGRFTFAGGMLRFYHRAAA